jgi:tetratricopeptide (TPR) repeat protein
MGIGLMTQEPQNSWWPFLLTLAVAVGILYGRVIGFNFVDYDDYQYIIQNPFIQQGLSAVSIRWAFTSFYASNWHPLTWLSHLLDMHLFGLRPAGYHAVSILLHAMNTLLLAQLLRMYTKTRWRSFLVALLFAIHPLHVESVAFIAERKDLLCTCFFLLTMISYYRYTQGPGISRYAVMAGLFICALLAKPMAVTLPCLLLLLDYWPLDRFNATTRLTLILEKVPLLLLSAASCIVTYLAQQAGQSVVSAARSSLPLNLANALRSYGIYLLDTFLPTKLAVFYPFPKPFPWVEAGAGLLALLLISALVVYLRRRHPYLLVGWLWFLGTLIPVIGIVRVGLQSHADRYTYIPSIGLFIAFVWGCSALGGRFARLRVPLWAASSMLLVVFSILSWQQVGTWRDGKALFAHALEVTQDNWLAHHNYAIALNREQRSAEAMQHLQETVRIYPDYKEAYFNLGNVSYDMGNREQAIGHYQEAIRLDPAYVAARRGLIKTYFWMGQQAAARNELQLLEEISPADAASLRPLFPRP